MTFSWTVAVQAITVFALIYWYLSRKYTYWSSRGVPGPKPTFLLGTLGLQFSNPVDEFERKLFQYGKMYGLYQAFTPVLAITDPELIKQIMVKDFPNFVNRRADMMYHEIWNQNLFQLTDERWKTVRSITSPSFTSGKLRAMYPLMKSCIDKLVNYLDQITVDGGSIEINAKEVISGFTMDAIASTSFATDIDTNGDRTKQSPFVRNAYKIFDINMLKGIAIFIFPRFVVDLLGIKLFFSTDAFNYLVNLTKQIITQRANDSAKRTDLVQLMLDSSIDEKELANSSFDKLDSSIEHPDQELSSSTTDQSKPSTTNRCKLTENEIIAQSILFILAGFETTSSIASFLIYELALNPDIQERLCQELKSSLNQTEHTDLDQYYDTVVNRLPYLDATIKETLRKYPPVPRLERRVGVDGYRLAGVELSKDLLVEVSAYAVHYNEMNYPDPERFNPDRFMPENKHLLKPYTFLPFGIGPRNCVGMRFAQMEIKLVLAQLIRRFRFEPNADTPIPIKFATTPMLQVKSLPLNISKRT